MSFNDIRPHKEYECDLCYSRLFLVECVYFQGRVIRLKLICRGCKHELFLKVQQL